MSYLRPDGKTQVTIEYDDENRPVRVDTVVVSTQHAKDISLDAMLTPDIKKHVVDPVLELRHPQQRLPPAGQPDRPLRGRRPDGRRRPDRPQDHHRHLRRDGRHGGRSPARTRRRSTAPRRTPCAGWPRTSSPRSWPAAARCRSPTPSARRSRSASTSTASAPRRSRSPRSRRPCSGCSTSARAAIIRDLDLLRPIYAQTAAYGHFGRELPDFNWEKTDRVDALRPPRGLTSATSLTAVTSRPVGCGRR